MEISTSILSVDKEDVVQKFYDIEVAKTDYFHIDVMDGKFVVNDTRDFMYESAQTITHISNVPLDVHLMVYDVEKFIDDYIPLSPSYITIHYESFNNSEKLLQAINKIKNNGVKSGISIKPKTNVEEITEFLPYVNMVQVMTVEPGKGGQKIITETIGKIKELNEYREKQQLDFFIEADGGINVDNVINLKNAGVDIIVAGTAIVKSNNMAKTIENLR